MCSGGIDIEKHLFISFISGEYMATWEEPLRSTKIA